MPLTTADMRTAYSAITTNILRDNLQVVNACNRDFQAELQSAYDVQFLRGEITTGAASTYARAGNWAAQTAADYDLTTFALDQASQVSNKLDILSARENPINALSRIAEKAAYDLTRAIEVNVIAAIIAGVGSGQTINKGSNSDYISRNGEPAQVADLDLVYEGLDEASVALQRANVFGMAAASEREINCFMSPGMFRALRNFLIERHVISDAFGNEAFREPNRVANPPAGFAGRVAGVNIHLTNMIPTGTVGSNKVVERILIFPMEAVTFAARPPTIQMLTPETNQTAPDYVIRELRPFGRMVVNANQIRMVTIRTTS